MEQLQEKRLCILFGVVYLRLQSFLEIYVEKGAGKLSPNTSKSVSLVPYFSLPFTPFPFFGHAIRLLLMLIDHSLLEVIVAFTQWLGNIEETAD